MIERLFQSEHWHFSAANCSTLLLFGCVATIVIIAGVLIATGK